MSFSLHDASVRRFLQTLGAVAGLLDKAEAFCGERGIAPETLIETRLIDDMLPFGYQVKSTVVHSLGAIEGVRKGVFSPDFTPWPTDFAGLRARVAGARSALEVVTPEEVDGFLGKDMRFEIGERIMPFTAEGFLLSFSLPNFYFHATTAYDLLRSEGVAIGKRDYLGTPDLRT